MLPARIKCRFLEGGIDICKVRDLVAIERLQHASDDHAFDVIVGGHDNVITRVAVLQLGEKLVIVSEKVHAHCNACGIGKIAKRVFANVGVPVVEIQFFFFFGPGAVWHHRKARGDSAGRFEKATARGREWCETSLHGGVSRLSLSKSRRRFWPKRARMQAGDG